MPRLMQATRRALRAPVRNRYFWGKLLDAEHLKLEQRYHNEKRWLLNRHAHGTGVLCGLDVELADEGRLWIRPGVALDGLGREIILPESYCVEDPTQPTDECGEPDGDPVSEGETVWICLAYHECDIEPVRALVDGCDPRDGCQANAVRERFRVQVHRTPPPVPETVLDGVRAASLAGPSTSDGGSSGGDVRLNPFARTSAPQTDPTIETGEDGPLARTLARLVAMRGGLCRIWGPECGPGELECVPIAQGTVDGEGKLTLECGLRRLIPSNADLLDGLLLATLLVDSQLDEHEKRLNAGLHTLIPQGNDQSEPFGGPAITIGVVALDANRNPLASRDVRFHVKAGGGGFPPTSTTAPITTGSERWVTTTADGVATVEWALGEGLNTVEAVLGTGPARFEFTATGILREV